MIVWKSTSLVWLFYFCFVLFCFFSVTARQARKHSGRTPHTQEFLVVLWYRCSSVGRVGQVVRVDAELG